jgi:hypothetical protein
MRLSSMKKKRDSHRKTMTFVSRRLKMNLPDVSPEKVLAILSEI